MQSRSTLGVLVGLAIFGCGGSQSGSGGNSWVGHDDATGHDVNITQGPLPAGQTFTGVYRSAQIGDINVVQTGDSILGRYEYDRADCHVLGRLEGSASGNLFRFSWREDRRACGHIEPLSGRGYFLLAMDDTGGTSRRRLWGKWGYQDDHSGGPWTAFVVPNQQPSINAETSGGENPSGGADNGSSGDDAGASTNSGGGDNSGSGNGGGLGI